MFLDPKYVSCWTVQTWLVQSSQIFKLEGLSIKLLFIGKWRKQGPVSKLFTLPICSSRPNLSISHDQGQSFSKHLIFSKGLVSHSFAREHLLGIRNLKEGTDEVSQTCGHLGFVFKLFVCAIGNVTMKLKILRVVPKKKKKGRNIVNQ